MNIKSPSTLDFIFYIITSVTSLSHLQDSLFLVSCFDLFSNLEIQLFQVFRCEPITTEKLIDLIIYVLIEIRHLVHIILGPELINQETFQHLSLMNGHQFLSSSCS